MFSRIFPVNYFGIAEYYRPIPELDSWIRRRVGMYYIKMWRMPRTRIRNLNAMDMLLNMAIWTGCIERGWWCLSGVLGVQNAFTNRWLKQKGLVSVKELWRKIHYGNEIRPKLASC